MVATGSNRGYRGPLPIVVECPVGGHVLHVVLRQRLGDIAMDKLGDLAGRLGRLHTPELVDVILGDKQGCKPPELCASCCELRPVCNLLYKNQL